MDKVLVLNQSYEPISIIAWKKAIILSYLGKVEVVREYQKEIRTISQHVKMPAVVRLTRTFQRPRKKIKFNRQNVMARDRYRCQYCGKKYDYKKLTLDHVVAKSNGGRTCWENIVTCCIDCNNLKKNKLPQEAGLKLRRQPARPDWIPILVTTTLRTSIPEQWKDFCYAGEE